MKRLIDKVRSGIDIPFESLNELRNNENIFVSLINMGVFIMLLYHLPGILSRGMK